MALRVRKRFATAVMVAALAPGTAAAALGSTGGQAVSSPRGGAFAWLRPRAVPASWSVLRLPGSPAQLPLPSGWRQVGGDAGTRTAELTAGAGEIAGFLNATPRQGGETLANWRHFRPAHNREEGDRRVRVLAAAQHLRFRGGSGSCVVDTYLTTTNRRYREVACLVSGHSAPTVIVAAAPPSRWAAMRPVLERAISSFAI